MSIITLQFGQCGNQIGQTLYNILEEDLKQKKVEISSKKEYAQNLGKWFRINKKGDLEPHSILIDTETKVVNKTSKSTDLRSIIAKPLGGSANNWAYGYTENSRLVIHDVLNVLRQKLEDIDNLETILNCYSLSGGTGSGVGCRIIEKIREELPKKSVINCAVLPYAKGEIATQSYNCILNLSKLYSIADSTILFENERLLNLCKYTMGLNDVTYANINSLICQQLASVFQPIKKTDTSLILNTLSSHPSFKFLQIRSEPNLSKHASFESNHTWAGMFNSLSKQNRFDLQQFKNLKSDFTSKMIANVVIARGDDNIPANNYKMFTDVKNYVSWIPKDDSFKFYSTSTKFLSYSKYVSQVFNGNNIVTPLNAIVDDAWTAFTHGAYFHHYNKYGVDEEYFLNSFQIMENMLDEYKNI